MFSGIDFLSGDIRWIDDYQQEDMLQVIYPNNYVLDMGWYDAINKYVIYIIKDFEWGVPVVEYIAANMENARTLLLQAIIRIEEESNKSKSYYGDLWKTEVIEL